MVVFSVREYTSYDEFVREWCAATLSEEECSLAKARERGVIDEQATRLRWQLLGELNPDELLLTLPKWLAEETIGFIEGGTPTEFVGRIGDETEKAILFIDSAPAKPLVKRAHRIHMLETSLDEQDADTPDAEQRAWLQDRLTEQRNQYATDRATTGLSEEWLPKSQILRAVRRANPEATTGAMRVPPD
jgi:hypothetical protein